MSQYRRSSPQDINSILDSALGRRRLDKKLAEYAAFPHWPEIVGAETAAIARPEKIIGGKVLVVRVIDAVWAQELSLQKDSLLERIHAFEDGAVIEEIRFTIGSPKSFTAS